MTADEPSAVPGFSSNGGVLPGGGFMGSQYYRPQPPKAAEAGPGGKSRRGRGTGGGQGEQKRSLGG